MNPQIGKPCDSGVTLRTVLPDEAGEMGVMAGEIWPATYRGIIPEAQIEFMLRWMYSPSTIIEEMTREGILYLWILLNAAKAGFIAAGPSQADAAAYQLHKFYVLPGRQGQGIGSRAMNLLIDRLLSLGSNELELRVNRHNSPAIAFYQKHDFEIYAEDCREIGGGFVMDDFLMRRFISDEQN